MMMMIEQHSIGTLFLLPSTDGFVDEMLHLGFKAIIELGVIFIYIYIHIACNYSSNQRRKKATMKSGKEKVHTLSMKLDLLDAEEGRKFGNRSMIVVLVGPKVSSLILGDGDGLFVEPSVSWVGVRVSGVIADGLFVEVDVVDGVGGSTFSSSSTPVLALTSSTSFNGESVEVIRGFAVGFGVLVTVGVPTVGGLGGGFEGFEMGCFDGLLVGNFVGRFVGLFGRGVGRLVGLGVPIILMGAGVGLLVFPGGKY